MRIGLVMDATCDLPRTFIDDNHITVLPITIKIDQHTFVDVRDLAATENYVSSGIGARAHTAETDSLSVDAIRDLFLGRLILDYDAVYCLTVAASRSPIYANATQASFAILGSYREIRKAAGHTSPFLMRVIDTKSLFAGQGPCVVEGARLIAGDAGAGQIAPALAKVAAHSYTFAVVPDLRYVRARTRKRGDRSIGLLSAALGSALDIKPILRCFQGETEPVAKSRGFEHSAQTLFEHAAAAVERGLLVPAMCVSFGGDHAQMEALPGYAELAATCTHHDATLYPSVMSITGMVNIGIGALSVGYAAEDDPPF